MVLCNLKIVFHAPSASGGNGGVNLQARRAYQVPPQYGPFFQGTYTEIELEHIRYVCENMDELKSKYYAHIKNILGKTNIVSLDLTKELLPGYNGVNEKEYHAAANGFSRIIFRELVSTNSSADHLVIFTAGGPGSGKTSSLHYAEKNGHKFADHTAFYDSTLSDFNSSVEKISEAHRYGHAVEVVWVYRDPFEAFKAGVIPRVEEEGRIVGIWVHVQKHLEILETIVKLKKNFGDSIKITFIDNSGEKGSAKVVPYRALVFKNYTKQELTDLCRIEVEKAHNEGRLSDAEYREMIKE
jgi:hypothetical protein